MATAAELQVRDKIFIGGEWVEPAGGETLEVTNSATEETMGTIVACTAADADRAVLAARDEGRIVGYVMLIRGVPDDDDVQQAVTLRPAVELSKMYVLPDSHGAGVSAGLMTAALRRAAELDAKCVWLGVNQQNQRAQRFYTKHGFTINGTKTFRLGAGIENDYVMVRPL